MLSQLVSRAKSALRLNTRTGNAVHELLGDRPVAVPAVDILESDRELRIVADVPGAMSDAVAISCDGEGTLVFGAMVEDHDRTTTLCSKEYELRAWRRSFRLPPGFDGCKARARLREGLLTITVPRQKERGRLREIPVRPRASGGA